MYLILTKSNMIYPFLNLKIPLYCFFDTLLKLEKWLPTQFLLQLSIVDSVTHIVTHFVCYISCEVHILAFLSAEKTVNSFDDHLDEINVLPFFAPDIVRMSR